MSRNSQKFTPPKSENNPTPTPKAEAPAPANSIFGLSFVVPTEEVRLPSEGKYYPATSPLYQVETIEVRHMTSKEEDILTSSGQDSDTFKIYDKLIESLIIDKNIKADDILEEDKLALILSARISGYGNMYETQAYCGNCKKQTDHTFDLTKTSFLEPDFKAEYSPEENTYSTVLPKSKIEVKLMPLTEQVKKDLESEKKQKQKYNLQHNSTIATISKIIISANGVADRSEIAKLSEVLPAMDAKYIMEFSNSVRPTLSTKQEVECGVCGTTSEQEAPITWAFFRTEF